ncbi:MAG: hypothetical protein HBSAPP04_00120 [Ignavibacteriaceae bacterium]|nr:MAG: hypothetical protein HBSAPP04_00120 [Ignavibacteriaceae bacterium]
MLDEGLTLTIHGNYINNGVFIGTGTTVAFRGYGTSSVSGSNLTFHNLEISKFVENVQFNNAVTVSNNLTINAGSTFILSGTAGNDLRIGGNFTNNVTFIGNGRAVMFNGSSSQDISGYGSGDFDYVEIDNSNGLTLSRNITIGNELKLSNGILTLGAYNMTLGSSAIVSGIPSSTKMVNATGTGKLQKMYSGSGSFTFPVGDASSYTPVTLNFTGGTFDGTTYAEVKLTASAHPNLNPANTNYLKRYWTISSNVASPTCDVIIRYADGDINGDESNFVMGRWTGTEWLNPTFVSRDPETNTITANTFGFSDFTGGEAGALPVELTSFNAAFRNGLVDLKWETKTEVNNYGFEVERKSSNADWTKIGFVEGHGTANSPKYYNYQDKPSGTGKFSYRLKQIDNDGQFEYSPVVEVLVDNLPNGFVLEQNYPNPFNPETSIRFALKEDTKSTLKVFNAMGQEVATLFDGIAEAGRYYDVKFSGTGLSSGFYIYKLVAGDFVSVKKMLLMK